jgi:hypothetical protein
MPLKSCDKNASTPDEQADIEYDGGEIIDERKKSVTPIRLIRRSNNNSNRNSLVLNESDSEDSNSPMPVAFKFNPNNPFYEPKDDIPSTATAVVAETTEIPTLVNSYEEGTDASSIGNKDMAETNPRNW